MTLEGVLQDKQDSSKLFHNKIHLSIDYSFFSVTPPFVHYLIRFNPMEANGLEVLFQEPGNRCHLTQAQQEQGDPNQGFRR